MTRINNSTNKLDATDTVQDLSHDCAAAVQGGADKMLRLFKHADYQGQALTTFPVDQPNLLNLPVYGGAFNDQVSSIENGSDYTWEFFTHSNYQGSSFRVKPGQDLNYVGSYFNDKISSFRRVFS